MVAGTGYNTVETYGLRIRLPLAFSAPASASAGIASFASRTRRAIRSPGAVTLARDPQITGIPGMLEVDHPRSTGGECWGVTQSEHIHVLTDGR